MLPTDANVIERTELDMVRSILVHPDSYPLAMKIKPEHMVNPAARMLWRIVTDSNGKVTTASELWHRLPTQSEGAEAQRRWGNIEGFRRAIWANSSELIPETQALIDRVMQRQMSIELDVITQTRDHSGDIFENVGRIRRDLDRLVAQGLNITDGPDLMVDTVLEEADWARNHKDQIRGWKTGDKGYDQILHSSGGLTDGKLIVLGALTNHGKSLWLLKQALAFATTVRDDTRESDGSGGKAARVGYISSEMGHKSLVRRIVSHFGRVDMNNPHDPKSWERAIKARNFYRELTAQGNFRIIEETNIDQIRRTITALRHQDKIDIAVIDYIGGITGGKTSGDSYSTVGEIVHALQDLARGLEMPIFTAAQLNRVAKDLGRPDHTSIADSWQISGCADMIHVLIRPQLMNNPQLSGANVGIWTDIAVLTTTKNRNGESGMKHDLYYEVNGAHANLIPVGASLLATLKSEEEQKKAWRY